MHDLPDIPNDAPLTTILRRQLDRPDFRVKAPFDHILIQDYAGGPVYYRPKAPCSALLRAKIAQEERT